MNTSAPVRPEKISLMTLFGQFYHPIGKIKLALNLPTPGEELAKILGQENAINDANQAGAISNYLARILEVQEKVISTHGSLADVEAYRKAKYIMAALADEIFLLTLDTWSGKDDWLGHLLEEKLFGTSLAGNQFFDVVDSLIEERTRNMMSEQLASVCLLAMRLGFKGIYRQGGEKHLDLYKQRLYRLVGNVDGSARNKLLFPLAYKNVLNPMKQRRLAPLSKWHRITLYAVIFYLLISSVLWSVTISPITHLLNS